MIRPPPGLPAKLRKLTIATYNPCNARYQDRREAISKEARNVDVLVLVGTARPLDRLQKLQGTQLYRLRFLQRML